MYCAVTGIVIKETETKQIMQADVAMRFTHPLAKIKNIPKDLPAKTKAGSFTEMQFCGALITLLRAADIIPSKIDSVKLNIALQKTPFSWRKNLFYTLLKNYREIAQAIEPINFAWDAFFDNPRHYLPTLQDLLFDKIGRWLPKPVFSENALKSTTYETIEIDGVIIPRDEVFETLAFQYADTLQRTARRALPKVSRTIKRHANNPCFTPNQQATLLTLIRRDKEIPPHILEKIKNIAMTNNAPKLYGAFIAHNAIIRETVQKLKAIFGDK